MCVCMIEAGNNSFNLCMFVMINIMLWWWLWNLPHVLHVCNTNDFNVLLERRKNILIIPTIIAPQSTKLL